MLKCFFLLIKSNNLGIPRASRRLGPLFGLN